MCAYFNIHVNLNVSNGVEDNLKTLTALFQV